MTFDDLLADTFELATGTSRASARRTKRFRHLHSEVPHIPYLATADVAEMMLLGEMIADKAFATLPLKLRKLAKQWRTAGHEGQVEILNTLFRVLGDESHSRREAAVKKGFDLNESLPRHYGKWGQGDLTPNCLGMTQMLIGFARAAGAPHMMVDTLRRYDMYANEYRYLRIRDLLAIIEPYRNVRWINAVAKIITKDAHATLSLIAEHIAIPESHASLSIRTDDEWWIIDPYMQICCKDNYDQKSLDRVCHAKITKNPSMAVTIRRNERKQETIVDHYLDALKKYIPYLDKLDQPRSEWSFNQQGLELIVYALLGYRASDDERAKKDLEIRTIDLSMRSIYPRHVYVKLLDSHPDQFKINDNFIADLMRRMNELDRTKRKRNQAYRRLVKGVIADTYNRIYDVDVAVDSPPILREYLHPTLQLAVKTVDQIATIRQVDAPQLIKFGSNQWLIYNMLGSVERSGDKRLRQIFTRKVRLFEKNEWAILPQLQPHLSKITGEDHDRQPRNTVARIGAEGSSAGDPQRVPAFAG